MDLELRGKCCLVSGASRGIGRAIALTLAREGARVLGVARTEVDLVALLAELDDAGGGPHAIIAADVTTADGASAAVDGCVQKLGAIDVVIANVGKSFAREAAQMDDDDLVKSLDMNLLASARVVQRAVPHMQPGGAIVLISSIFGREAGGAPGYNIAKAGVIAMAKALARDYAKRGIRVNSVAPGSILFPGGGWHRRQQTDPVGIAAFVERELPFGRFGRTDEVADVVAFLVSARASWVSGACIVVDGGQSRAL
ncbi:MAG TPA: SDR family NAD(P)-dependent oxidoreductase [Kofleriaceae bacterium]|nr:SDR family NAD(P)-dependent oxidoreductase [Kofleriaceae bacterium]